MVIYLKHPQHGTKVACDEAEATYDESNGWQRYVPGRVVEPPKVDVPPEPETLESLRERYKEKFGKAAHHKKSAETLKQEISG